jgi:hypothetical protein
VEVVRHKRHLLLKLSIGPNVGGTSAILGLHSNSEMEIVMAEYALRILSGLANHICRNSLDKARAGSTH